MEHCLSTGAHYLFSVRTHKMKASLWHLTLKMVFVLKLASGRGRNELHALSCDEKCYRFRADWGLVILITEQGFLAKNQKPQDSYPDVRAFGG